MAYLDVNPMIASLRARPDDFEMDRGWLQHTPSRHSFKFDEAGHVRLEAQCNCMMLAVSHEQEGQLWQAFQQWHQAYWIPVEINREFASHFAPPTLLQRLYRRVMNRLRRRLRALDEVPAGQTVIVPAE